MRGLLRLDTDRNFCGIGREAGIAEQRIHHFISNSPWSSDDVCNQVIKELKETLALVKGGVLLVDESADEKAGDKSAGAAKQYNGRLGKLETSQVGVFFSYANMHVEQGFWTWIKGELYLPEKWFSADFKKLRDKLGIPSDLNFKTKIQIAWEGIKELTEQNLQYEIVAFDGFYGRDAWLRANIRDIGKIYVAEIPSNTKVYLEKPEIGILIHNENHGRTQPTPRVLSGKSVRVDSLHEQLDWKEIQVRAVERGHLCEQFAAIRVWTVHKGLAVEDWLIVRKESDGIYSYALCNASIDVSIEQLAWWKCQRYFVERSNQDAKSEFGWDEFQARRYRAWEHHLSLTILASWFIALTKYNFAKDNIRDPELLREFKVDLLPALSVANIRELLKAVMPLRQLTIDDATELVVNHFINRLRSRKSRIKKKKLEQQGDTIPN